MNFPERLVLIRHAESERNVVKGNAIYFTDEEARSKVRGIPDQRIPLTDTGVAQAKKIAPVLRERFGVPDCLYHSGYLRTVQTTEHLLSSYSEEEKSRICMRASLFIRERDPGYAYDMTKEEGDKAFPWIQEHFDTFGGFFARPVGGESLAQVAERVHLFLEILSRECAGKTVFVVTHSGVLRCFRYLLEGWTHEEAVSLWKTPENCSISVYEPDPSKQCLVLKEFNTVHWK